MDIPGGTSASTLRGGCEASHPHLTTQKSFYVEIFKECERAELVTDDAKALREQLEAVTGERDSALEDIGASGPGEGREGGPQRTTDGECGSAVSQDRGRSPGPEMDLDRAPKSVDRALGL